MKSTRKQSIEALQERARKLKIADISVFPETIKRSPTGYFLVSTKCKHCKDIKDRDLRNLEKGYSRKCECRRGKYLDKRAYSLACRYNAMVQRCEKTTHVSDHNYRGRGIEVKFTREEFIKWALTGWPDCDFKALDFDRIDNEGDYDFSNLRLVTRSANLLNTRRSKNSSRAKAELFFKQHPEVKFAVATVINLIAQRKSFKQIVKHYNAIAHRRSKWKPSRNPVKLPSEILAAGVVERAPQKEGCIPASLIETQQRDYLNPNSQKAQLTQKAG